MFWLKKKDDAEIQQTKAEVRIFLPIIAVLSIILIVFIVQCLRTGIGMVGSSAKAAEAVFHDKKDAVAEEIREKFYQTAFNQSEQYHHVSNDVDINIMDVKETAKLHVLQVSVTEFSIVDKKDNPEKITSWLEVPVTGEFTVDLQAGEYLVDRARKTVTIRLPAPVLENVECDYENAVIRLFDNDWRNDKYQDGVELYERQCKEAIEKAKSEMGSNPGYMESAESSARTLITDLVQKVNSEIPGLVVEVEFVD